MEGHTGLTSYQPPGWQISKSGDQVEKDEENEEKVEQPFSYYPAGAGTMIMSGCFGTGYKMGMFFIMATQQPYTCELIINTY